MRLVKYRQTSGQQGVAQLQDELLLPLALPAGHYQCLADILEADDPAQVAVSLLDVAHPPVMLRDADLLAPIDGQEVWAAGVTYTRSKTARMEESAAAASCYDRVYVAERPELFFKATPHRVAGPGQPIRIRQDSRWNVPEPELTLVLNSRLELVGFTIGNDVSSRDIEGENPLYLPQAKVYDQCCALGPCITLADAMPERDKIGIRLSVIRDQQQVFQGETSVAQMARPLENLIQWLSRDNSFPQGVFLLTGTGIVPDSQFTLLPGDTAQISIDGIGTLTSPVVQGRHEKGVV